MFPAYKRPRVLPFRAPPAVQRLPIDLLRTSLVTRNPILVAAAVEDYYRRMSGAPAPQLLPQRLAFQQWKKLPGGYNRGGYKDWLQSASSVTSAMVASHVPHSTVRRVKQPETYDKVMAAMSRGANIMPQPVTDEGLPPIARVEPRGLRYRLEPPPAAFVSALHGATQVQAHARDSACTRAIAEAGAARARMIGMVRRP